jgi:ClpP class serine protease
MTLYTPRAARTLLNTPVAMHDRQVMMLRSALLGENGGLSRVRGTASIPEVDATAALASIRGFGGADSAGRSRPYQISTTGIALLEVVGDLVPTCDIWDRIFGGVTSYDDIKHQILFANEDSECRGIFIKFKSGGGLVDEMVECGDFIHAMSARNGGKPIYAYAADSAYSAAYLLFAACDKGFCGETGGVGSIGVKAMYFDLSRHLTEEGIDVTVFRSTPGKALASGVEPLDETEEERIQGQIDYLGSVFVKRVATYMPSLTQQAVAQTLGYDYLGPRAKAIGLVNDVMSMPEAWAKLERRIAR